MLRGWERGGGEERKRVVVDGLVWKVGGVICEGGCWVKVLYGSGEAGWFDFDKYVMFEEKGEGKVRPLGAFPRVVFERLRWGGAGRERGGKDGGQGCE